MKENNLKDYTPKIGEQLIAYCEEDLHVCSSRVSRAKNIVWKLNRLFQGLDGREALWASRTTPADIPDNLKNVLDEYISYCEGNENKQTTIYYKRWICTRFLKNLSNLGCTKIDDITGELIQTAFIELGYMRYWSRIGQFLRFIFENDQLLHDYSKLVFYRRKHTPHPTVYSPDEIAVVENSIDRSNPSGIRNYAILLLLSRYGIRARDVALLSFENIDFFNNRIRFIQQKTRDPWESELFPEVKAALQDYIVNVRPSVNDCSIIFMTLMIPYKPIDGGIINTMVGMVFQNSKVDTGERRHGSRSLRSSIASNMINNSISTEVVRRVLGHGTKYALKYYAKIDIESMRLCPLPVPEPSGTFAKLLSWMAGENHV
jgi:site-specific recombinase XerD